MLEGTQIYMSNRSTVVCWHPSVWSERRPRVNLACLPARSPAWNMASVPMSSRPLQPTKLGNSHTISLHPLLPQCCFSGLALLSPG